MRRPTLPDFQHEFGSRLNRGDLAGAAGVAAQCRTAWPDASAGWLLGSIAALLADDQPTALALVDARLAVEPTDVQCLLQKAECLYAVGDIEQALAAADAAAAHSGSMPLPLDAAGEFFYHAGEYSRAIEVYDRALRSLPADPTLHAKRADVHRVLGNLDLAARDYEAVLAVVPGAPKALKGLVDLRRQTPDRNRVPALQKALASATGPDAAILHFALAKSFEDLGDYTRSWQHLAAGNREERSRIDYTAQRDRAFLERIMAAFPDIEQPWPETTHERPIFIVGIPRTGTTLVERILGSHSQVHSAGEITALSEAIDHVLERSGADLSALQGGPIAAEYLKRCRGRRGDRPRFTDKLLINFFHCALILRAFPRAAIVHVTRHPLAACHAVYRTRFNGTYPFAYDLTEIGEFYLGYRRLMAHWHRVLPGRILDVAYEDIVTQLEPTTRTLLEFAGLPFEPGCLKFQLNPAPVKTTSSIQVRQPLYDSSLHLWQHYAPELAPLRAQLEAGGIRIETP